MPSKQKEFSNLLELMKAIPDEQAAIDHFTPPFAGKGWRVLPLLAASLRVYHFSNKAERTNAAIVANGFFDQSGKRFFEDSNLGLRTWMLAVWYVSSHKKSIASTQLAKDLGVTQRTAMVLIMHRLRHAARDRAPSIAPLTGEGRKLTKRSSAAKPKNRHKDKRGQQRYDRVATAKAIVAGAIERKGRVVARVVENVRADTLTGVLRRETVFSKRGLGLDGQMGRL